MTGRAPSPYFVRELRRALQHLYDPAELGSSPLIELLGAAQRGDPTSCLQELLTQAIEWLRPRASVPPEANAWRVYYALSQRYVEQFPQAEIADGLSVSLRQLRRLQGLGLRALASHLWARYNPGQPELQGDITLSKGAEVSPGVTSGPVEERELELLRQSCPSEPVDVATVLQSVLTVAGPLMGNLGVRAECVVTENVPRLAVPLTALRSAMLSILVSAIRYAKGGQIQITVETRLGQVWLCIHPQPKAEAAPSQLPEDSVENLKIASQLAAISGGSLQLLPGEVERTPFTFRLILPAAEQVPVLVVDDNVDTLQLYKRYLTGTRYRFIGVSDPQLALAATVESTPQVIVLDLMLPRVDGWELLGRLREHPKTSHIPIIVCSILPQEDLALTFGAAAFIRKPVSQSAFLSALDQELGRLFRESR